MQPTGVFRCPPATQALVAAMPTSRAPHRMEPIHKPWSPPSYLLLQWHRARQQGLWHPPTFGGRKPWAAADPNKPPHAFSRNLCISSLPSDKTRKCWVSPHPSHWSSSPVQKARLLPESQNKYGGDRFKCGGDGTGGPTGRPRGVADGGGGVWLSLVWVQGRREPTLLTACPGSCPGLGCPP